MNRLADRAKRMGITLTDDQLGELLSFGCGRTPPWLGQILRWAMGLPPGPACEVVPAPPPGRAADAAAGTPPRRPFWRFW